MERRNISSGSPYEPQIGFSRASRMGAFIAVSGTAPIGSDGKTVHEGDMYHQARRCLEIIVDAVCRAGGRKEDIIRTRLFLTDISRWRDAARTASSSPIYGRRAHFSKCAVSFSPTGSWRLKRIVS